MFRVLWLIAIFLNCLFAKASSPIDSESIITNIYDSQLNSSLLWGPYRSNLYMGVRPRGIPHSLMTGLLWYNIDDFNGLNSVRHVCDQGHEMKGYGWEQYDPRKGGRQVFHDQKEQKIELTTKFVKTSDGKSWAIRVKGVPAKGHEDALTTIVFYAGLEGNPAISQLILKRKSDNHRIEGIDGDVELKGHSLELGDFDLSITENGDPKGEPNSYPRKSYHPEGKRFNPAGSRHVSLNVPNDNVWQARDIFITFLQDSMQNLYQKYEKDNSIPPWVVCALNPMVTNKGGNLHLIQRVFKGEFEFDILYNAADAPKKISSKNFFQYYNDSISFFKEKFNNAFSFNAPFAKGGSKKKYQEFAEEMFSNLIGGIGYFQGTAIVDRSYSEEYDENEENFWERAAEKLKEGSETAKEEGPYELLTAVPSRPFFPRGFYWDEGFHLIPILEYDADIALEILKSWFALIDEDGWIAREQILGPEARSKVPKEFRTQFPHYANPPTLMLLLSNILNKFQEAHDLSSESAFHDPQLHSHNRRKIKHKHNKHNNNGFVEDKINKRGNADVDSDEAITEEDIALGRAHWKSAVLLKSYLKKIYPQLQLHYDWFRRTQKGDIKEWGREAFSKKEGYRWRGRTPNHCLTSGLDDYPRAKTPHTGELHVDLLSWIGMMTRSMKQLAEFLELKDDAADYAEIEEGIIHNIDDLHWSEKHSAYCDSTIDEFEEESAHVCHKGYISLFPFLLRLIPSTESHVDKVMSILNLISDPEELWTEYGIRSLSKSDKYYGTGENYWRGPIWININYMILDSLIYYHDTTPSQEIKEKAAEIYKKLRINLVDNVYKNWKTTGYAWEQYNPDTGKGQSVKHFLGWTSLVVMIMSMPETL